MKRIFFKIIKEDAQKKDTSDVIKEKSVPFIIAGDSIAKAMIDNRSEFNKCNHMAVKGGKTTKWVLKNFKLELDLVAKEKDSSWFKSASLIVIAGTNDGHGAGMTGNPTSFAKKAINNIKEIIKLAKSKGLHNIAVMRLAVFDRKPESKSMQSLVANRKGRGWMKQERTAQQWISDHKKFVDDFNSQLSSLGVPTFNMVSLASDRVHAASGKESSKLFDNAKASLGQESSIAICHGLGASLDGGIQNLPSAPDKSCSVNDYCGCVDRAVSDQITILGIQRALNILGIKVEESGTCNSATQLAIQKFQKQQQESKPPFEPISGTDKELGFLRCDACVGQNTLAAIKKELDKKGKKIEDLLTASERAAQIKKRKIRMSYTKGNVEDLQTFNETPLKGNIEEFNNSHSFPDGNKDYIIKYSLRGAKQRSIAKLLLDGLKNMGVTNPYVVMGILGCTGKESGYRIIYEGASYGFKRIKEKRGSVPKRVWKRFKDQGFGAPEDRHIKAISGGGRNGIALFNIAYGYSTNQKDERITMPVLKDGEINPALYDENLAGWKYRGTGPIQATFKAAHVEAAKTLKMKHKEVRDRLKDPAQAMEMAILISCAYMKRTYPWALKKYGKEPTNIQEGLEWAQNCVGGIGFDSPATAGNVLHKGFLAAIPWLKNNFRLEIKDEENTDV